MAQNVSRKGVISYQQGLLELLKNYQRRLDAIEKALVELPQQYSSPEIINQHADQWIEEILAIRRKAKLAAERIRRIRQS